MVLVSEIFANFALVKVEEKSHLTQGRHNLKSNLRNPAKIREWMKETSPIFCFVSIRCRPLCGTLNFDME